MSAAAERGQSFVLVGCCELSRRMPCGVLKRDGWGVEYRSRTDRRFPRSVSNDEAAKTMKAVGDSAAAVAPF